MTEEQRDYLADLAGRKGVRIDDTDNKSAAWASAKIEELKALPDAEFDKYGAELGEEIDARVESINGELKKWTFQR